MRSEDRRVKGHRESRESKKEKSRHRSKRKRHENLVEKEAKPKHSHRHRNRSQSPGKLSLEELADVLVSPAEPSTAVNTPSDIGSLASENLLPVEEPGSSSQRKSRHKKKSKKKHKHRHRREGVEEEGEGGVELRERGAEEEIVTPLEERDGGVRVSPSERVGSGSDEGSAETGRGELSSETEDPVQEPKRASNEPPSGSKEPSSVSERVGEQSRSEGKGLEKEVGVATEIFSPMGDVMEVLIATDPLPSPDPEGGQGEGAVTPKEGVATDVGVASRGSVEGSSGGASDKVGVSDGGVAQEVDAVGVTQNEAVEDAVEIEVHAEDVLDSALLEDPVTESQGNGEEGDGGSEDKAAEGVFREWERVR